MIVQNPFCVSSKQKVHVIEIIVLHLVRSVSGNFGQALVQNQRVLLTQTFHLAKLERGEERQYLFRSGPVAGAIDNVTGDLNAFYIIIRRFELAVNAKIVHSIVVMREFIVDLLPYVVNHTQRSTSW